MSIVDEADFQDIFPLSILHLLKMLEVVCKKSSTEDCRENLVGNTVKIAVVPEVRLP